MSGSFACPVGSNHSFTDTYGAPRSGGRRHEGVDIFAPYGSPEYAVESGVIVKAYSNRLGGLAILLRGNSGDEYYYAHQARNLVSSGQRVTAGQQIGTVGTSGNAQGHRAARALRALARRRQRRQPDVVRPPRLLSDSLAARARRVRPR